MVKINLLLFKFTNAWEKFYYRTLRYYYEQCTIMCVQLFRILCLELFFCILKLYIDIEQINSKIKTTSLEQFKNKTNST